MKLLSPRPLSPALRLRGAAHTHSTQLSAGPRLGGPLSSDLWGRGSRQIALGSNPTWRSMPQRGHGSRCAELVPARHDAAMRLAGRRPRMPLRVHQALFVQRGGRGGN